MSAEADRDRGEARRRALVGRAEDDQQEHHRHHDLGEEARRQRVAAGRVLADSRSRRGRRSGRSRACPTRSCRARTRRQWRRAPARRCRAALRPPGCRPPAQSPTVTAGLRWQPEMCPMAKAIVSTVRPKASETPAKPIPSSGKAAASTALPQPPSTSQNVPMNSAASFFDMGMRSDPLLVCVGMRPPAPERGLYRVRPGGNKLRPAAGSRSSRRGR